MHNELCKLGAALVTVASMPDEQLRKMCELANREVGSERGLAPLLADDPKANVGGLNHTDVIATITNGTGALARMLSDKGSNVCFLCRRTSACNDTGEKDRSGDEFGAVMEQHESKGIAVDEQAGVWRATQKGQRVRGLIGVGHYSGSACIDISQTPPDLLFAIV